MAATFYVTTSPDDEYIIIEGKDRFFPFGDWCGEKKKARKFDVAPPLPPRIPPSISDPQPRTTPSSAAENSLIFDGAPKIGSEFLKELIADSSEPAMRASIKF
ncbi:hypothetical protein PIB30_099441, partial [Stylosanthes scabra]|nr:hypothetical protein [Stylosanthes scabra]